MKLKFYFLLIINLIFSSCMEEKFYTEEITKNGITIIKNKNKGYNSNLKVRF